MLRYSSFREFPFNEIDHTISSHLSTAKKDNKYQKYVNDNFNLTKGIYYLENIRILKNFYDEKKYTIKIKCKLTKSIIINMIEYLDTNSDILEVIENWSGEKNINEDNINDGISEWFIKLKTKINLNQLKHIGGFYNNIDIITPTYTPEYLIRYDHNNKKYKIPINILLNGKSYDKIWYLSNKHNITSNEIFNYANFYIKKNIITNYHVNLNHIIMTYDGWLIDLWT